MNQDKVVDVKESSRDETEGGAVQSNSLRRRRRLSREERAPEAREAIFRAAMEVVGQYGYADATIARVTEAVGIAQGTFYLYFESRQALIDELLPHFGRQMLDFIGDRTTGAKDIFDMEERGFRAFFEYMKANPSFFRVVNEAEVAAPVAHEKHFKLVSQQYVESLQRSVKTGEIKNFDKNEMETIAYVLMSARSYLYLRYMKTAKSNRSVPRKVVETYMKFVRGGLR